MYHGDIHHQQCNGIFSAHDPGRTLYSKKLYQTAEHNLLATYVFMQRRKHVGGG